MDAKRGEPREGRGGFTLVELLVALAVSGVLLALLYQFFTAQARSHGLQEDLSDAQQSARVALEELTRTASSLGAGADLEHGQVRLLLAQPYQLVFNADLDAGQPGAEPGLAPGTPVPGAGAGDPYLAVPPGANAAAWTAETYRYTLDRTGDGRVTAADRQGDRHYVLYREKNGGANLEVAALVANPDLGEPLFRYWGDFDGDGTQEALGHVTAATSPRVARGEPLDAVVRRVEVRVVARTAASAAAGPREVRLTAAVSPENLWDCPVLHPPPAPGPLELPALRGQATALRFRVTRGGVPEAGRTVAFQGLDPQGRALPVTDAANTGPRALTDAGGEAVAVVHWPAGCDGLRVGTYTVRAWTEEPPTLGTPFGTCSSREVTVALRVVPGPPAAVRFSDAVAVASCGGPEGTAQVLYEFQDACGNRVASVSDDQARLRTAPDPAFFHRLSPLVLDRVDGAVTYESPRGSYAGFQVPRGAVAPNPYTAALEAYDPADPARVLGRTALSVTQAPAGDLADLTARAAAVSFRDCPDPPAPVQETFSVRDRCGNPLPTLLGTGHEVLARLVPQALPGRPAPGQGAIASPGNRAALAAADVPIVNPDGTDGEFAVQYLAPSCTVGALTYAPRLLLTPSWAGAGPRQIPLRLGPCGGCSVQVVDAAGNALAHLNQVCDGRSRLVVTQCLPAGSSAEVVVGRVAGAGLLSFDRNAAVDRAVATFAAAGAAQTASLDLFVGTARTGDSFRVAAFLPDQAAVQAGNGVVCQSELLAVDSRCSEVLISAVADNPQPVPAHRAADDTPLCGREGRSVYFRVKDCDQNARSGAGDDLRNTAGTGRGLLVEVVDEAGAVLDREGPDLLEVDVHGRRSSDSPYFQGALLLTADPADRDFSGRLRAPQDRVATLRARYVDPDDPADGLCAAEALLVPPLPACLGRALVSGEDWSGPLRVHWGDAVIAGRLALPDPPGLVLKAAGAAPSTAPYGAGGADPHFDAYVGGAISVGGAPLPAAGRPDQPFLPGGAGENWSAAAGHYFQAVPDTASLGASLDYPLLKAIARAWGVYWVPEAGGTLVNPRTLARGTFEEVTRLPGPGLPSATHDGRFLFVDAPPGLQAADLIDQAPPGALPTYRVAGDYYTEGLLYVAGSVSFLSAGGKRAVAALAPGVADARYDENRGGFARADLPVDYAQPPVPTAVGDVSVNVSGALYCDGAVELADGFALYGSLVAERGVRALGRADLWYDARWRDAPPSGCARCCALAVTPTAGRVALGAALALSASGAAGAVVWESLAPQVASVDQTGRVRPVAAGHTTIRAVDAGGCVAQTSVEVF